MPAVIFYPFYLGIRVNYQYDPEADGYIALLENNDTEIYSNVTWEGISRMDDMYLALYKVSNHEAIIYVIPEDYHHLVNFGEIYASKKEISLFNT